MSKELDEDGLLAIIKEAIRGEPTKREKREALKLRKKRREEFLTKAEILLNTRGMEELGKGVRTWRTPFVAVSTPVTAVNIYVAKYVYIADEVVEKTVGIATDVPEERLLFSIEQKLESYLPLPTPIRTIIRNHLGAIATNDQVLRGLQALEFIEKKLG